MYQERGHSFTEMMVVLLLSGVIIQCVFELYVSARRSVKLQETLNDKQSKIMTINTVLSDDVRQAGYLGCKREKQGVEVRGNVLTVWHAAFPGESIVKMSQKSLMLMRGHLFKRGDSVVISDCMHVEKNTIERVAGQHVYLKNGLQYEHDSTAELSKFVKHSYYVEGEGLYMQDGKGNKNELVQGVKDFQVVKYPEMILISYRIKDPAYLILPL